MFRSAWADYHSGDEIASVADRLCCLRSIVLIIIFMRRRHQSLTAVTIVMDVRNILMSSAGVRTALQNSEKS